MRASVAAHWPMKRCSSVQAEVWLAASADMRPWLMQS